MEPNNETAKDLTGEEEGEFLNEEALPGQVEESDDSYLEGNVY